MTAPASRRRVAGIRLHRSRSLDAQDTTHQTRQAFEDDRAKDAALTAAGYKVLRFTGRQLRDDPHTVADRLEAVMRPVPAPLP